MPVIRIASINAEREMQKRKFVSRYFERWNAIWHNRRGTTSMPV
jgi:hypothetical protein